MTWDSHARISNANISKASLKSPQYFINIHPELLSGKVSHGSKLKLTNESGGLFPEVPTERGAARQLTVKDGDRRDKNIPSSGQRQLPHTTPPPLH